MKLFQYIYYFFRSVFYRGFYKTFRMLYHERKYEKQLHIRTSRIENPGTPDKDYHHYQGASYSVLFRVLGALPEALKNKPFIDYGCGKGRALFVAEQCGFTHLVGIDIEPKLLNDARENLQTYRKHQAQSCFELIASDATMYSIPSDAAVFYFFNPFGESIMKKVAEHLLKSFREHPRDLYVVYINPVCRDVFTKAGFMLSREFSSITYTEALIFSLTRP